MTDSKYILKYFEPAPVGNENIATLKLFAGNDELLPNDGWEKWSLPIGCGQLGANIFGRTITERIQITENSFANKMCEEGCSDGLENLAEIYLDFFHTEYTDYVRFLDLNNAVAGVSYIYNGVKYNREYFASYPERAIVVHLEADKKNSLEFKIRAVTPFLREYTKRPGDGVSKTGSVNAKGNTITLESSLSTTGVIGELQISVKTDGIITAEGESLGIKNADTAEIYITAATNYKLESRVFTEQDFAKKLSSYEHPHKTVSLLTENIFKKDYETLRKEHISDYRKYFSKVTFTLDGENEDTSTDNLIKINRECNQTKLDELIFHYGRYLLISSSRESCLPSNLQGVWNRYASSPWSSGYWHNINIQMNYWMSTSCNLFDMFKSYLDYFTALMPLARIRADEFVKQYFPENYSGESKNGWAIGTGAWPYDIYGISTEDHSGPGTIGMTAMLFWDYYDFTRDKKLLKEKIYPILYEAALFLSKIMVFKEGAWLIKYSASPEQWQDGKTYRTTGCAFDQQMCDEVFKDTLKAAEILDVDDDGFIDLIKERLPLLEPYIIGASGQIKEYREENYYGEIGEKPHRHLSHFLGIYPGLSVSKDDKELSDAVRRTLELRQDATGGWPLMHRMCVFARMGNGNDAYKKLKMYKETYLMPNLWNGRAPEFVKNCDEPFQIDANFGLCAGIAEMLLQSNSDYIELIPAIPDDWKSGSFAGFCTRGGFTVDCTWSNYRAERLSVTSTVGGIFKLRLNGLKIGSIISDSEIIDFVSDDKFLHFKTEKNKKYYFKVI